MYCKKCGSELYENDNFCPRCGAKQHEPDNNTGPFELALKIFALICAFIFFLRSLEDIAYAFDNLWWLIFSFFGTGLISILYVLSAIAGLWMVFVLALMALRRTSENTPTLTFGVLVGGVMVVGLRILRTLLEVVHWDYFDSSISASILGVIICVGGVYALLSMMGQAPKLDSMLQDLDGNFSVILNIAGDCLDNILKRTGKSDTSTSVDDYSTDDGYDTGKYKPHIMTNRSLIVFIVLSMLTCGIYGLYFIYCLARDVNIMCEDDGEKTSGILTFIILNFITYGIYSLYWQYKLANRLASNASRYGLNFQENGTSVLVWNVIGIFTCGIGCCVAMHIVIKNTNYLAAAYNRSGEY